jgi:dTDP-4-dehydrorhamnose reductase
MRVLVTGAGGLVGSALCGALRSVHEVHGTIRSASAPGGVAPHGVELSEAGAFATVVDQVRPEAVVHTAYSTADLDRDVRRATEQVATACAGAQVPLIHISTDAVFDGDHAPYGEDDLPQPIHPYGQAKRDAELIVEALGPEAAVVRTALIAHLADDRSDTATEWILAANRRREPVTLFTDEFRTVVRLDDLVGALGELVALDPHRRSGRWHVAGPDRLSRWELGQILADRYPLDRSLLVAGEAASMGQPRPRDVSLTYGRLLRELSIRPSPVATVPPHGQATR